MKQVLPRVLNDVDVSNKRVLVRGDFDVDDGDNPRADAIRNIVTLLKGQRAKAIRVIGLIVGMNEFSYQSLPLIFSMTKRVITPPRKGIPR